MTKFVAFVDSHGIRIIRIASPRNRRDVIREALCKKELRLRATILLIHEGE